MIECDACKMIVNKIEDLLETNTTKVTHHMTSHLLEKPSHTNLVDFDQSQISNVNTSLKRPFKKLLNAYFSFKFGQCK